jgi:molecular chaperone GrpE
MKSKDSKKAKKEAGADKSAATEKDVKKLQQQIDELTNQKDKLFDKLQRVSADYANYQKRTSKQITDSVAYEKKAIIKSLLPSLDNSAHALASAAGAGANDGVVKGIRMVFEHMLDALKAHGLEPITAMGAEFNPAVHEAVMQRAEPDKPDNIVLEEFQTGYKLNGQVIRPSKVSVNKLPAKDAEHTEPKAPQAVQSEETEDQTAANNTTANEE